MWALLCDVWAQIEISQQIRAEGGGGIGAVVVVSSGSVLAVALGDFVIGFRWTLKTRGSQLAKHPSRP